MQYYPHITFKINITFTAAWNFCYLQITGCCLNATVIQASLLHLIIFHCTKLKFSVKNIFVNVNNPEKTVGSSTVTKEILNGKLVFLCCVVRLAELPAFHGFERTLETYLIIFGKNLPHRQCYGRVQNTTL